MATGLISAAVEVVISDRNGDVSVLLDAGGDHIVIRHETDGKGHERDISLAAGSFAWDRAVARAERAAAFLETE